MPELPEVETIKRDLEKNIVGKIIQKVVVYDGRVLHEADKTDFIDHLQGRQIAKVSRRGKAIILSFKQGGFLVVQLKMTGQLIFFKSSPTRTPHLKIVFQLSEKGQLVYNDQRVFGKLRFVEDLDEIPYLKNLGIEPLNGRFSPAWLKKCLQGRTLPIKNFLMHQDMVAGIGNIYASEILFAAGIRPQKPARRLKQQEIQDLHAATIKILNEAIRYRGTSMRNYRDAFGQKGKFNNRIRVYDRQNEPCCRCGSLIQRIVQSGRSTFFCGQCQK